MRQTKRLYIGVIIGIVVTIFVPVERVETLLRPLVNLIINVGRYFFVPALFFGIVAGFGHQLTAPHTKKERTRNRTGKQALSKERSTWMKQTRNRELCVRLFFVLLLTTTLLVIIGGGGILLFSLPRLSIIFQEFEPIIPLGLEEIFSFTFPNSLFTVFAQHGGFIMPIVVVAFLFGIAMKYRLEANSMLPKISIELSDLFSAMLNLYVNFLGVGMILISSYFIVQLRLIDNVELYYQFILTISALTIGIIFIIYPLIAILLKCKTRPMRLIRNILSSTVVSVISGDSYFSSIMVLRMFRSRFPANRILSHSISVVGILFSRSGSAFVVSAVFFMVLRSYVAIEITFLNAAWIMGAIILFSPLASTSPRLGVVHLLVAVMALYGNGLENGFLIIVPILPLLVAISTLLDTFTIVFFGYLLADKLEFPTRDSGDLGRIKRN